MQPSINQKMFAFASPTDVTVWSSAPGVTGVYKAKEGEPFVVKGEKRSSDKHLQPRWTVYRDMEVLSPRYLKEKQPRFNLENTDQLFSRFSCLFQPIMFHMHS